MLFRSVHIALPLVLSGAWGFGYLFETLDWKKLMSAEGGAAAALTIVALYALGGVLSPFGTGLAPFASTDLAGLKATGLFACSAVALVISGFYLVRTLRRMGGKSVSGFYALFIGIALLVLQARTAFQSSFVNYDQANEYLVYAHSSAAPKVVLREIEEIAAVDRKSVV